MEWVRKIESYFETPKVSTHKALELLVQEIVETIKAVELCESGLKKRAHFHLSLAEEQHNSALAHYQLGEYRACQRQIELSSTRLQMSQAILAAQSEGETNWAATTFDFPKTSVEFLLNHLLESIAKTKLMVESDNLHVNQKAQDALFESVKFAKQSLSALKNEDFQDSRHLCLGALLLLQRVCVLISLDNRQSIFQVDFPEAANIEPVIRIRQVITEMSDCSKLIADAGLLNSTKIERHFKEAEEHLFESMRALSEFEYSAVENAAVAALSEIQLCKELATHSAFNQDVDEDIVVFSAERSFKELEAESAKIIRLAQRFGVRDFRIFQRRIESSLVYFGRAAYQFKSNDLQEALRLSMAAYLDLDFAWQIALTTARPEYRDTEF